MKNNKKIIPILLLLGFLIISACTPSNSSNSEMDSEAVYTAAAQTVEAQLTSAAIQPTNTNTLEPSPTNTMSSEGNQPQETQETQGGNPGEPVATNTGFAINEATATSTNPPPTGTNITYEFVSQDPLDSSEMTKDTSFDMVWEIKNTSDVTWTMLYTIEFFMGDRIGGGVYTDNRYYFPKETAPGETIRVYVDMHTPTTAGEYYSWWKLKDDEGRNFGDVDVTLFVKE